MRTRSTGWTLSVAAVGLAALGADDGWRESVARRCTRVVEEGALGLAVGVVQGGEVALAEAFGRADLDAARSAAAFAEPLAAGALFALVQRGELDLADPLTEHLPEMTFGGRRVEVGQLLAHTSGVPDFGDFAHARGGAPDVEAVRAFLRESPLESDPGTCFAYSGSNLLLAWMVLEAVTGEPFDDWLEREVFEPLGMEATRFGPAVPAATLRPAVLGRPRTQRDLPGRFAATGLETSLRDLLSWQRACAAGELFGADLLRRATRPVPLAGEGGTSGRGLGFELAAVEGVAGAAFGGASEGAGLRVAWYPEAELAVALLVGGEPETRGATLVELERGIARTALGLEEPTALDLALDRAERRRYVGGYYVGCNRYAVREVGERLELDPAFGEPFLLRWQGGHRFLALNDAGVELVFDVSEQGIALGFRLAQHGFEVLATRLE